MIASIPRSLLEGLTGVTCHMKTDGRWDPARANMIAFGDLRKELIIMLSTESDTKLFGRRSEGKLRKLILRPGVEKKTRLNKV
jgi:hypothetical protein